MIELKTKVKIKPLEDLVGIIIGIWIAQKGTQYFVRYFHNGEAKEVYLYPEEVEVAK